MVRGRIALEVPGGRLDRTAMIAAIEGVGAGSGAPSGTHRGSRSEAAGSGTEDGVRRSPSAHATSEAGDSQ
jgi:hypothetical protein